MNNTAAAFDVLDAGNDSLIKEMMDKRHTRCSLSGGSLHDFIRFLLQSRPRFQKTSVKPIGKPKADAKPRHHALNFILSRARPGHRGRAGSDRRIPFDKQV